MSTQIGDRLKRRYEIKEQLGHGAHGTTWKAWDASSAPPKFCVIKEPLGSHHAIKELEAESAAAGLLHHKNIVPVLEFNENDGFLVQEFVRGLSLQARLRQDVRNNTWPSLEEARAIVTQCLEGLEYAHEKGRIHGDVKPGNIMLQEASEARLTDFGVSRFVHGSTVSGGAPWDPSRFASATYAAPEVLHNRSWSFQSDLFSVGILAYLLFSKRHAYVDEAGLWNTSDRILDPLVNPPSVRTLNPAVEHRVEAVVGRLLERDPTKRYRTAREALDQLIGETSATNSCPQCGVENPLSARFCNACGKPFASLDVPETEPDRQLSISHSLFRAGKTSDAIRIAQKTVEQKPDFGKGWGQLAFMLNYDRRYEEAVKAAENCIKHSPDYPAGYRSKGFALSALGRFPDALDQFDLALEREERPRDRSQIFHSKAYTFRLANRLPEAEEAAREALTLDPLNTQASKLLNRLRPD